MTQFKISLLAVILLLAATLPAVAQNTVTNQNGTAAIDMAKIEGMQEIQSRNEDSIMSIPGVFGIGIGLADNGTDLAYIVYVDKDKVDVASQVPTFIEGVPVRVVQTDSFKAY